MKPKKETEKRNQHLVTGVLGSLLNKTGRNLIKFHESTSMPSERNMPEGVGIVYNTFSSGTLYNNAPGISLELSKEILILLSMIIKIFFEKNLISNFLSETFKKLLYQDKNYVL